MSHEPLSRRLMTSFLRATVPSMLGRAYAFDASTAHVPREGAALLVCNHVSFIDWLFLGVSLPRVPRFVMHHHHWRMPAFRWFFDLFDVIPIAPKKEDPALLDAAMEKIDRALANGELVAIWPEGTMTPDGELSPFRSGVERIVLRRPVPVVPLALRGLWGSFFSRAGGEPMKKMPRARGFHRVELVSGAPIPPERVSMEMIRERIAELRGETK